MRSLGWGNVLSRLGTAHKKQHVKFLGFSKHLHYVFFFNIDNNELGLFLGYEN